MMVIGDDHLISVCYHLSMDSNNAILLQRNIITVPVKSNNCFFYTFTRCIQFRIENPCFGTQWEIKKKQQFRYCFDPLTLWCSKENRSKLTYFFFGTNPAFECRWRLIYGFQLLASEGQNTIYFSVQFSIFFGI